MPRIALNIVVKGTIGLTRNGLSARDGGIAVGGRFVRSLTHRAKYDRRALTTVKRVGLTHRL